MFDIEMKVIRINDTKFEHGMGRRNVLLTGTDNYNVNYELEVSQVMKLVKCYYPNGYAIGDLFDINLKRKVVDEEEKERRCNKCGKQS